VHTLVLPCINQQTKLEVPNLTISKDRIGSKFKKMGHVTLTTPLLKVICHP